MAVAKVAARWIALLFGIAALAGCNESSGGGGAVLPPPPPAPKAAASPPPAPIPDGPRDFVLSGEMTQGGWAQGTAPAGTVGLTLDGAAVAIAPDGRFLIAFDRDAKATARLAATLRDGRLVVRELAIGPRAWAIEHVNIARRTGGPTEAFMRLRRPELARINAARAQDTGAQGWRQTFIWPAKGRLSGMFGSQRIYRGEPGSYHSGTDIATGTSGTPFAAPADGVVILAAETPFTLEGKLLMIDHGMGLNSAFLHCSELMVREGDRVKQGQIVGRIGATGRATGPHLHWSIKWRDARLDPILFTGPMR